MAKVYTSGTAQVLDSTPAVDYILRDSANRRKAQAKAQAEAFKQQEDFLGQLDVDISKIQRKRGEELQQRKAQAEAQAIQLYNQYGITPQTNAKVKAMRDEILNITSMANDQQDVLKAARKAAETKSERLIDKEKTFKTIAELERMSIEEFSKYDKPILVYKGEEVDAMLGDFVKNLPKSPDLSNEDLELNLGRYMKTESGQKTFEEGIGTLWNDPQEFRDYLRITQDFNYRKRQSRGNKSDFYSFSKTGATKKEGAKNYWKKEVDKNVSFTEKKNNEDVLFTKTINHPSQPSMSIPSLEIEKGTDANGNPILETIDLEGNFIGYRQQSDGKMYALYKRKLPTTGGSFGWGNPAKYDYVYAPIGNGSESSINKERQMRGDFFDAFYESATSGETTNDDEEFGNLIEGVE